MSRINPRTITAIILISIALGMFLLNLGGFLDSPQSALTRPLSAIQTWISLRFTTLREFFTSPRDVATLRQEIVQLEAEVARLQQEVITLQEQAAEAEVLAALLNYARGQPENRYVGANVIGRDVSPFLQFIWINQGSNAGIAYGMPVVTDQGLVGRVIEVRSTVARIQLITDPEAAVNVRLQNARSDGVLAAQLNGEIWVDLIDQNAVVEPGDLALTSGLGGNYPVNIPIGEVLSVRRRDFEIFQQAVIQSVVDFDNLTIVLVITNFQTLPFEATSP
jgi:rod shape-determining protein MreC